MCLCGEVSEERKGEREGVQLRAVAPPPRLIDSSTSSSSAPTPGPTLSMSLSLYWFLCFVSTSAKHHKCNN